MPISPDELADVDALWRAANFLTVGQLYLRDNPLLREPLQGAHVKPRLHGRFGAASGLNLVYAHLHRLIRHDDGVVLFVAGSRDAGPAVCANLYLEGSYTATYPAITQDAEGMRALFRACTAPGGSSTAVSAATPSAIHEGSELGSSLAHAFGAAFDNPDLIVVAVVGAEEAETAPLEGSWKAVSFLNPERDGAVLPVLHLNEHELSGPSLLGRSSEEDITSLLRGYGYAPTFVAEGDPLRRHEALASALEASFVSIRRIQREARARAAITERPSWPVVVLRMKNTSEGPAESAGAALEATLRAARLPETNLREHPAQLAALEAWLKSYRPEALFDREGRPQPRIAAQMPRRGLRMGDTPHANGGSVSEPLQVPELAHYAVRVVRPGVLSHESVQPLGALLRDIYRLNRSNFRLFCADEASTNRLRAVFELEQRCLIGDAAETDSHVASSGRVMDVPSQHACAGWLQGYLRSGRHGLLATSETSASAISSMIAQHASWLAACEVLAFRRPIPSLNMLLTSTSWRNDGGPPLVDLFSSKAGAFARLYLPPDANCLLSVAEHCLRSRSHLNLIVIDEQPALQWLDLAAAQEHCARGASIWHWASTSGADAPDIVLACAGDGATLETLAAAQFLREHAPDLRVRVVNVVDLVTLFSPDEHPRGLSQSEFTDLFTPDCKVVFAFHGNEALVHELLRRRPARERFHVHGARADGSSSTPFEVVVRNESSRYHIAMQAIQRARRAPSAGHRGVEECLAALTRHAAHLREQLDDLPAIRSWTWTGG